MSAFLYVVAFVLLGSGASIGEKLDRGYIVDRPRNPVPLRLISSLAGVAGIAWLIYGFFPYSWWLPLVALLTFMFVGAWIIFRSLRSDFAPLIGMLSSVAGAALAIGILVVGA